MGQVIPFTPKTVMPGANGLAEFSDAEVLEAYRRLREGRSGYERGYEGRIRARLEIEIVYRGLNRDNPDMFR